MNKDCPSVVPFLRSPPGGEHRAVIVTSYMTGAPQGRNVGVPGYSYDFVVRLFAPLLARWGEVAVVGCDELDATVNAARRRHAEPVHLSFLPLQDVRLSPDVPNVVVPAWEYPDIPDHEFDDNPQNNWVATAQRCDGLMVGGPFTAEAFRRSGVTTPIYTVPVPTPQTYFEIPPWKRGEPAAVDCSAGVFSDSRESTIARQISTAAPVSVTHRERRSAGLLRAGAKGLYARCLKPLLRDRLSRAIRAAASAGIQSWRGSRLTSGTIAAETSRSPLRLDGVVYTSIFNPIDGRKNWHDLLTGFLHAFRDCDDATLVLKLITGEPWLVYEVWNYYRCLGIPHRCRVAIVSQFLTDEQLLRLADASTYYVTTTRAEGNCLPLMNYLAAGRPGISPRHTAIADYFGEEVGFVVDSHPEPTAFPHDRRLRRTTTWHRLVWPSLVEQFRNSYIMAKCDGGKYERLAQTAREKMLAWSHPEAVAPRLYAALDCAAGVPSRESYAGERSRRVA